VSLGPPARRGGWQPAGRRQSQASGGSSTACLPRRWHAVR